MSLTIYNSYTGQIEEFKPLNEDDVLMYTCGPTVYHFQHIGNYRTFFLSDIVNKTLRFNGYNVKSIMNLTDIGHLTGDNLGDADTGKDRLEIAAEREGKSAQDIADFYIKSFYKDFDMLNFTKPAKFTRATDYIRQQIDLIQKLEIRGYTYLTTDGVYFDTSKYSDYLKMSGQEESALEEGARVAINHEKKNKTDFALWKFSKVDENRWQEYESPWGVGFPGWHLECSAMALNELGDTLDIHIGGEDHKMIHHPNEMAQSECATGHKFVNYWMHVTHLQVEGGKMGKSKGNFYTVADVIDRGFTPVDLRFFYMAAHYRSPLNFTWESLQSSHNSLVKMYDLVSTYKESEYAVENKEFLDRFTEAINSDFNMPKAIAIAWELLKTDVAEPEKVKTLLKMDEVLGLKIENHVGFEIPQKVQDLAKIRWEYKISGIWDKADSVRKEMNDLGYTVEDLKDNYKLKRKV